MALLVPVSVCAQSSMGSNTQSTAPPKAPKPAASQASGSAADKNEFPENTDSVPVIAPTDAPPAVGNDANAGELIPHEDTDPAKSPDDVGSKTSGNAAYSSSTAGMDELLPEPDTGKLRKGDKPIETMPHASAKEDESVGDYYLSLHNWQAALSRYESALVLDPENPDVYWGMAEAQRNLRQFDAARQNYLKVIAYDPDSKHSKDAKKILRQPEFEGTNAASGAPVQK